MQTHAGAGEAIKKSREKPVEIDLRKGVMLF